MSAREMKDSGVAWLGEIPAGWEIGSLGRHYDVQLGKMLNQDAVRGQRLAPYLRNQDVQWGRVRTENLPLMNFNERERVKFSLKPGDLLVCEGGDVGRTAVWQGELEECFFQKAVHRVRPRHPSQHPMYLFWLMWSACAARHFDAAGHSTILHLPAEQLRALRIPFPPMRVQERIVALLGERTATIDAAIAEHERNLDLLAERRRTLVSSAVTRGLDPKAPMRESGVSWIGAIPTGWGIVRLGRILRKIEQGWSPQCLGRPREDDEWGVLKAGCVNSGTLNLNENKALPADLLPMVRLEVQRGDVLMNRASGSDDHLGAVGKVSVDVSHLLLCDKIYRLILRESMVRSDWIVTVLQSFVGRGQIANVANGQSTLKNISQAEVRRIKIPLPSLSEQDRITAYLDEHAAPIDAAAEQTRRAIALLREYRQSLITAAVTGRLAPESPPS